MTDAEKKELVIATIQKEMAVLMQKMAPGIGEVVVQNLTTYINSEDVVKEAVRQVISTFGDRISSAANDIVDRLEHL
jgi:hypothetical protein